MQIYAMLSHQDLTAIKETASNDQLEPSEHAMKDVKDVKDAISPVVSSRSKSANSQLDDVFLSNNTTDNDCCLRVGYGVRYSFISHYICYFPLIAFCGSEFETVF